MKHQIAIRWTEALRSGNYFHQSERFDKIKHGNTYSILGVLSDLHAKEFGGSWVASYYLPPDTVRGTKFWLAPQVMEWSGIRHKLCPLPGVGVLGCMESRGWTFNELADLIDKHWEEL